MNLWEMIKVALEGIWANKLRSSLTMLGIIIGVLAVIIVVSIGQSGREKIMTEMESIGSNLFVIWVQADEDVEQYVMKPEECRIIKASVSSIRDLVPVGYRSAVVQSRRKKESSMVIGTDAAFAKIRNVEMADGRFFNSVDNAVSRRVIVINTKLANDLFGQGSDPIGQKLLVGQMPMIVCGVSKPESSFFDGGQERAMLYMPVNLFLSTFDEDGIYELEGSAISKDKVTEATKLAVKVLSIRHHVKGNAQIYRAFNMEQEMQAANKVTGILTLIIGAIAGISLLVGGIGVMNIMLVSVTERTREIGIRMAVGACRRDIMIQFLIEAVVLSLLGGTIGMVLGLGGSAVICKLLSLPFVVSPWTVVVAFLFSSAVGIFFGLYPANRAARLDPIDALRYE